MVAIVNVSENHGIKYGKGLQKYEVRINFKVLVTLDHNFKDGLPTLLRRAADAVEKSRA